MFENEIEGCKGEKHIHTKMFFKKSKLGFLRKLKEKKNSEGS
jgi:hypothetical protein